MHLALSVTAILLALTYPVQGHRHTSNQNQTSTTCKHASTVEVFAASFYTALIVTQDPYIIHGLELPGEKAAECLYPILSRVLKDEGLRNSDKIAWQSSRSLALKDTLKLTQYFELTAYNVGDALQEEGLLDCKNAVSMALDYFEFVREAFKGQDGSKFDTYILGTVQGMTDFFHAHGLRLEYFAPAYQWRLPLVPSHPAYYILDTPLLFS